MANFYEGSFEVDAVDFVQPFQRDAVGFNPGTVYFTVETQNVRLRYGPKSPTPTDGHLIFAGGEKVFDQSMDILNLKFIAVTGTATVQFTVKGR